MIKVLLTGVNGQLGTYVRNLSSEYPEIEIIPCSRKEIDLSDLGSIQEKILAIKPDVILNASAYTAVDKAEGERELAMAINGYAVGEVAKACEQLKASLIQVSTDYVFDGEKEGEYLPDDPTSPVNYYGETKLRGELLALEFCSRATVVRTSWVYSEVGKNFKTTMERLFQSHKELRVVDDQVGRPTHAKDLAKHCLELVMRAPLDRRVTHFAGDETMSWYGLASQLLSNFPDPVTERIIPIESSEYPTPAKRPRNSRLSLDLK